MMTNNEAIGILALVVETAKGRCFVKDEAISDAYDMAISALEAQEKAQKVSNNSPELGKENGELISRQAAIDAISEGVRDDAFLIVALIKSKINKVPPAQPEIIRCKDCRHGVDYYHEGDCYCSHPKWGLMYFGGSWEFYCADAERRTDE